MRVEVYFRVINQFVLSKFNAIFCYICNLCMSCGNVKLHKDISLKKQIHLSGFQEWLLVVYCTRDFAKNEVKNEKSIIGFHFYFLAYLMAVKHIMCKADSIGDSDASAASSGGN